MGHSKPGIRRWRNLGTVVMSGRPGVGTEGESSVNLDGSEKVPIGGPYLWWRPGVSVCTGVACAHTHVCMRLQGSVDLD